MKQLITNKIAVFNDEESYVLEFSDSFFTDKVKLKFCIKQDPSKGNIIESRTDPEVDMVITFFNVLKNKGAMFDHLVIARKENDWQLYLDINISKQEVESKNRYWSIYIWKEDYHV